MSLRTKLGLLLMAEKCVNSLTDIVTENGTVTRDQAISLICTEINSRLIKHSVEPIEDHAYRKMVIFGADALQ